MSRPHAISWGGVVRRIVEQAAGQVVARREAHAGAAHDGDPHIRVGVVRIQLVEQGNA